MSPGVLWILVVMLILFAIITYVLFAPFYIEINSTTGLYRIRLHHLAAARLLLTDTSIIAELTVAGLKRRTDLLAGTGAITRSGEGQVTKKRPPNISLQTVKALINTFRINKCRILIDFGDNQVNGILYPLFYWMGRTAKQRIAINFQNRNEVIIEITNNLYRIISTFISYQFFKKNKYHGQLK